MHDISFSLFYSSLTAIKQILTGHVPSGAGIEQNLCEIAGISKEQAAIILKCLSYNLDDRYSTCSELKKILLDL